jgi:hypothetical protein
MDKHGQLAFEKEFDWTINTNFVSNSVLSMNKVLLWHFAHICITQTQKSSIHSLKHRKAGLCFICFSGMFHMLHWCVSCIMLMIMQEWEVYMLMLGNASANVWAQLLGCYMENIAVCHHYLKNLIMGGSPPLAGPRCWLQLSYESICGLAMVGFIGDSRLVMAMPIITTPKCALRSHCCQLWCQDVLLPLE